MYVCMYVCMCVCVCVSVCVAGKRKFIKSLVLISSIEEVISKGFLGEESVKFSYCSIEMIFTLILNNTTYLYYKTSYQIASVLLYSKCFQFNLNLDFVKDSTSLVINF